MTQPLPRLTEPEQFHQQLEQNALTDIAAGRTPQAAWQEQALLAQGALAFAVLTGREDWVRALSPMRFDFEARAQAAGRNTRQPATSPAV